MTIKAIIESPFANKNEQKRNENLLYVNVVARKISMDSKGDINPLFFHTFYTQFLNDDDSYERQLGLEMSFVHHAQADVKYITIDRGITEGMSLGVKAALAKGKSIRIYTLCPENSETSKAVAKINALETDSERWESAQEFVSTLYELNELGDFTDYRQFAEKDYQSVISVINDFFLPFAQYANSKVA